MRAPVYLLFQRALNATLAYTQCLAEKYRTTTKAVSLTVHIYGQLESKQELDSWFLLT